MTQTKKPPLHTSEAQKELDKCEKQFEEFDEQIKSLTLDRMNEAPKKELEPQTKLSSKEIENSQDIYLKPFRTISSREKFNEKFRDDYNFAKEYVRFIAENKEIKGETIDVWTKKFPGQPAEEWLVPVNKPVWGPRYLAEQIRACSYHTFVMDNSKPSAQHQFGTDTGQMIVDNVVPRLTAEPVSAKKSIFMGGF